MQIVATKPNDERPIQFRWVEVEFDIKKARNYFLRDLICEKTGRKRISMMKMQCKVMGFDWEDVGIHYE